MNVQPNQHSIYMMLNFQQSLNDVTLAPPFSIWTVVLNACSENIEL